MKDCPITTSFCPNFVHTNTRHLAQSGLVFIDDVGKKAVLSLNMHYKLESD